MDSEWELARQAAKREQETIAFQESLVAGKEAEKLAINKLTELGFTVTDISENRTSSGEYSPFDLVAVNINTAYIIDVKRKSAYIEGYWVSSRQLLRWQGYNTLSTKIILFVTIQQSLFAHYSRTPDPSDVKLIYRFIPVSNIEQVGFYKKGKKTLHIRDEDTNTLDIL
jgi:hypothetical protein